MARITKAALEAQIIELQAQVVALTTEHDALRASDAKASELVEFLSRPEPSASPSDAKASMVIEHDAEALHAQMVAFLERTASNAPLSRRAAMHAARAEAMRTGRTTRAVFH